MRAHLIHGFNVSDGGKRSVGQLVPYLERAGHDAILHDYGWVGPVRLRWRNEDAVEMIAAHVQPGDVLIGHSNGAYIAWLLADAGFDLGAVVCIQPALRRDTRWPEGLPVLCLYNPHDWAVVFGRVWGRFASVANPCREIHGWGAAGRYGFDPGQPRVVSWDTATGRFPARYHSGVFRRPAQCFWLPHVVAWGQLQAEGVRHAA